MEVPTLSISVFLILLLLQFGMESSLSLRDRDLWAAMDVAPLKDTRCDPSGKCGRGSEGGSPASASRDHGHTFPPLPIFEAPSPSLIPEYRMVCRDGSPLTSCGHRQTNRSSLSSYPNAPLSQVQADGRGYSWPFNEAGVLLWGTL